VEFGTSTKAGRSITISSHLSIHSISSADCLFRFSFLSDFWIYRTYMFSERSDILFRKTTTQRGRKFELRQRNLFDIWNISGIFAFSYLNDLFRRKFLEF
jgi:hypothetical protein